MSTLGLLNSVFLVLPMIVAIYLGVHSWRRRPIPGAVSFMIAMLIVGGWCATSLMVVVNRDTQTALFWVKTMLAVTPYLPATILVTVLQTNIQRNPVRTWWIVALLIIPSLTAFFSLTSGQHNIYIYNIGLIQSGDQNVGWTNEYGPWSVVHLSYSYITVAFALVLLARQFIRMRYHTYRMRVVLLLAGVALPFITNIANTLLSQVHYFITPMMFNVSAPIFFWAIFRYRLFEVLPIARDRAFEHMDDAIVIIDAENRIVDVNPSGALLAGETADVLLEKPLFQSFMPFEDALKPLLETENSVSHKSIIVQTHNQQRYFDVTISAITNDQEQVGKLIMMRDMTDQRVAEMRAHQLEMEHERLSALSEFIEAASHEFRTPLSIIKNSTFIIGRSDDSAKRTEKLTTIDDQTNRITKLVEELLNVVRVNALAELTLKPLDINTLVETVKTNLSPQAAAKNIHLQVDLAPQLPHVNADITYLSKAIDAVAHNAIRYTPAGGVVTITTSRQDAKVVITVQDTGIGIDPENLPHIFDVFYRVDKAHTTAGFGTGLTVANRVISLHGGQIQATSQPGIGTTITIMLPIRT